MAELDTLLALQVANCEAFDRFFTNFKKCSKANQTRGYLKGRLTGLDSMWNKFSESHLVLLTKCEVTQRNSAYFSEDFYSRYEELYFEYCGKINDLLDNVSVTPMPSSDSKSCNSDIKLPPIDLPKFSGNYLEWLPFRDMFVSLVNDNHSLNGVQKLHYLKSSVWGEAEQLLRSYAIIENNFVPAWEALCLRFDNKRLLVNAHLSTLLNTGLQMKETASSIRRLYDETRESLAAITSLGINCTHWDLPIIHIQVHRLPHESRRNWEQTISISTEPPTLKSYLEFLEARFRTLEAVNPTTSTSTSTSTSSSSKSKPSVQSYATTRSHCAFCNDNTHNIRRCSSFLRLTTDQKWNCVKSKSLCFNCLASDHSSPKCPSNQGCSHCGQRHHTLLHNVRSPNNVTNPVASLHANNHRSLVLLSTALIKVQAFGKNHVLRALIDTGSQASFITTAAMQTMRLQPTPIVATITSLGSKPMTKSHKMVQLSFSSCHDDEFQATVDTVVLPSLTELIPQEKVVLPTYPHLSNLELADPTYNEPGAVDIILGSEIYPKLIRRGLRTGPTNTPVAQNTTLGWIILGPVPDPTNKPICSFFNKVNLDDQLRRFWELEEPEFITSSNNETECEEHYGLHYKRNNDGRYEVSLPFKKPPSHLGSSLPRALSQLKGLERRFLKDPELKLEYSRCIQEYIDLGHMEPIPDHEKQRKPHYYMPHHAVRKISSTTTKLRVVFNASCKTDSGESLNDILHVGPSLHQDLPAIITRWRFKQFAYTADMKQMFRQIRVNKTDTDCQRIVWRPEPYLPVQHYRLQTVTFGVTSAPYLAMRTVQQLANDEEIAYEDGSKILSRDLYVDNILSGADTIEEGQRIQQQLIQLLQTGGFQLRQWAANHKDLLSNIPKSDRLVNDTFCIMDNSSPINMLGILWQCGTDQLSIKMNIDLKRIETTKREVLSCIARLFDPLGWLAPVIVRTKMFMKELWKTGLGWDDRLPENKIAEFAKLKTLLSDLDKVTVPRWIFTTPISNFEIHGFSDASEEAYAAAVYLRVRHDNTFHTSLLMAKTRVSPTKADEALKKSKVSAVDPEKDPTIPRLELCGASLLSKLITRVVQNINAKDFPIFCWTDSTIVLAWLAKDPKTWRTFVANRVSSIHSSVPTALWQHVPTAHNPADLPTRGMDPKALSTRSLWWHGPDWLCGSDDGWPTQETHTTNNAARKITSLTAQTVFELEAIPLDKYSSYNRLLRVTAYCFRFIENCRKSDRSSRSTGHLTTSELANALLHWIRQVQRQCFHDEIQSLKLEETISSKSKLRSLTPILDKFGTLRVGGRLKHADLTSDEKQPIILPHGHHFSKLIIAHFHHQTLHGNLSLTMNLIRQSYWILKLRSSVKTIIHHCLPCFRQLRATTSQLMGNLPKARVTPARPFMTTGIDYAGPLSVRMSKGRSPKTYKGYIAIFVCFVTKAIHLEAVSDLTTEAMLAALRRFIARRGLCKIIYSDCGTNFVGAKSSLDRTYDKCIRSASANVAELIANDGIRWNFIPAGSPHFGGLWEAGVRSVKHHLRRTVGNHTLTYEELSTVLTQIEACLNSRPLHPLSDNPEELNCLTPGHFLIGDALLSPPQEDLTDSKLSRLQRWHLLQKLVQDFWHKWRLECLHRLQQRPKWQNPSKNLQIGDLVIIKDERLPPLKWAMARVVAQHPGSDGFVRVVDLKTSSSTIRRPVHKLCLLPTHGSYWDADTELKNRHFAK